jgi:hypothetical protein
LITNYYQIRQSWQRIHENINGILWNINTMLLQSWFMNQKHGETKNWNGMNMRKPKWKGEEIIKELQCESIKDDVAMFADAPTMAQNKLRKGKHQ